MNVEIGTEAAQFPGKEYIIGIFLAMNVQGKKIYERKKEQSIFCNTR
jgi:hypothetical protein